MLYECYINYILTYRGRFEIPKGEYKERHHIIPRCMGGTNDKDNLIDLFPQEHYIAHKLLAQQYPQNMKLVAAWSMMAFPKGNTKRDFPISEEDYSELKQLWSKHMSEHNPGLDENGHPRNFGKHLTESQKQHLSEIKRGKKLKPHTIETNMKIRDAKIKYFQTHESSKPLLGKKCITDGKDIKYIDDNCDIPDGWHYGNCKTSGTHDMSKYFSDEQAQINKHNSMLGDKNPNYGNGIKISGGKNSHNKYIYTYKGIDFECRKYLIEYLNQNGIKISSSTFRSIESGNYTPRLIKMYGNLLSEISWRDKNEDSIS